ncbi:hypothetical protein V1512DRAFT_192213, partial [Lipomyces arxii]|uniref:uncharacterized protein n=1 Tax=Lipomyces arxii TaxID=56418 RepID=UPI0034CD44C4
LFDDVLSLEESFYNEGYNNGIKDGEKAGTSEGKQFGLETGFQRFLTLGIVQGRCEIWNKQSKQSRQLQVLTEMIAAVDVSNTEHAVDEFSKTIKTVRNRVKVVQRLMKDPVTVDLEDDAVKVLDQQDETVEDVVN